MVMQVALRHRTSYRYDRPVGLRPQIVRLRPAPHCRTKVLSYALKVEPRKHFINWQQDPFGNYLARLVFPDRTTEFRVEVGLVAEMAALNPFDFFVEPTAETYPFTYEPALKKDLGSYLECEQPGPLLVARLAAVPRTRLRTIDFLVGLNQSLQQEVSYIVRMEPGIQACDETLALRSGSCRDSAWLLVQMLRHLGLAARFVSGYLIQLKPDVAALDGPSGAAQDFTDLHAWTEVYLPGGGWIGLDPTSGLLAGEGHLPLACTPDPSSAAPITGAVDPCEVEFGFEMSVRRILEQPRVTKPYTEAEWQEILTAGNEIDAKLQAGDVRLTVGGEPTFVAIDNRDEPEWNTAAVGPTKRGLADDLIRRLQARFAPGGLLQYSQGKWYPGEPLPRWAFALHWRGDGLPLWRNATLAAVEGEPVGVTLAHAERFMLGLTRRLELDPNLALPAYEDPDYFLAKQQSLPPNVETADNKLDDPMERSRLAKVFERGLDVATGYVLPIQRWQARGQSHWRSQRWETKRGKLFLVPGDSPVGYRLPLGSLPWEPPDERDAVVPLDPFAAHAALPAHAPLPQQRVQPTAAIASDAPRQRLGAPRTAFAIEPRDGQLCIFMPPTESAEEFTELVTAIEDTAAELDLPVLIEGYPPPDDPRLNVIKVTPDPGVIEVNIHPSRSWEEQVAITEALYEEARLSRLDTCKFLIDGRQVGTGGGNHVVIGGKSPADSPFLRRPDLLASLVAYWQNHPSLSYLFSGLFIGPTSQAPRLDEAREDQLYELEIALSQIPDPGGEDCPPWMVDRIFRNLLIDVTGNTHRAEVCIDKLYSPDGPTGRLGLVEFRAFEMPPHARMSLAQQLVLRALVAWFWEQPFRRPPIRFGTALHDRYMLPHYVWRDFEEVCADLVAHGLPVRAEWFKTHFEFRFPYYGHVTHRDIGFELRAALEPWHVMGEEGVVGGTARYVDSSLERLQIKVEGLQGTRFAIACNGHALPLQPTGTRGEHVAGVRFRAWQPPACLHPTIGIHSPLRFDLVDRWAGRSLGGCTYHVMHPAGRSYDTLPINELEAEGRRLSRFEAGGHTPGPLTVDEPVNHPEFPHTLDLRRFR